jgi:short subunit dehydrogenase-like uncharacterized protein
MTPTPKSIAVYGATGHTGQFVVREAMRRGVPVIAVGRSAARLDECVPSSVAQRVADLNDHDALIAAFNDCAVVINTAGPFLDTAAPVVQAALRAGCHYLDVTAEQASAKASFDKFDAPARQAQRAVIPAAGFYGGLADLLASAVASSGPIDEITVAVALTRWWPTDGTRKTGARNTAPRVVVKNGQLTPLIPSSGIPDWNFDPPIGTQRMVELPFSEIITMHRHLGVKAIRSMFNQTALDDIRDASTPAPTAVDNRGRSAQRFEILARVTQNGQTTVAGARGQDIYAVTAPIVIESALRLMNPSFHPSGALALAQALDPVDLLRSLHGAPLDVHGVA